MSRALCLSARHAMVDDDADVDLLVSLDPVEVLYLTSLLVDRQRPIDRSIDYFGDGAPPRSTNWVQRPAGSSRGRHGGQRRGGRRSPAASSAPLPDEDGDQACWSSKTLRAMRPAVMAEGQPA